MNELQTAMQAVKEAEKIVMKYFGKEKGIREKAKVDLVTNADVDAEQKIVEIILRRFPQHGFILEESEDLSSGAENLWVIDPIDGTTSFAHNYPMFSISVALFKTGKPVLGVVLVPYLNELFYAEIGKGAFLNEKRIEISKISTLGKSLIATGFPYTRMDSSDDNLVYFSKMAKVAQGLRRSGSAAIDLCYVACGRLDGYWELGLKIMDSAAGQIILHESGGTVTDFNGNPINKDFSKIVASNGIIHNEVLHILK